MSFINVEIKARCEDQDKVRRFLKDRKAVYKGLDKQTDVYFNVAHGRLKLRRGSIENNLIFYERENDSGPKQSKVIFFPHHSNPLLEDILKKSLGILVTVEKQREIYFIDNVKFHLDNVNGLGKFVEIEAIDYSGKIGIQRLQEQCQEYISLLKIKPEDLISESYSDLLLRISKT